MVAEWQSSEMCLACVNLPGSAITLQKSSSLEVCVRYLTIHYTAVLSFCRRYPTGRWNDAVSPTPSTLARDLYVILLVSWIVSVGRALDYDLLVGFPASWKLLAPANTLVLLFCSSHCFDAVFGLVQQPLLFFPYAWVCVSGQTGLSSEVGMLAVISVSLSVSFVVVVALSICFFFCVCFFCIIFI